MIGEAPAGEEPGWHAMVAELGIADRVLFEPPVDRQAVADAMARATLSSIRARRRRSASSRPRPSCQGCRSSPSIRAACRRSWARGPNASAPWCRQTTRRRWRTPSAPCRPTPVVRSRRDAALGRGSLRAGAGRGRAARAVRRRARRRPRRGRPSDRRRPSDRQRSWRRIGSRRPADRRGGFDRARLGRTLGDAPGDRRRPARSSPPAVRHPCCRIDGRCRRSRPTSMRHSVGRWRPGDHSRHAGTTPSGVTPTRGAPASDVRSRLTTAQRVVDDALAGLPAEMPALPAADRWNRSPGLPARPDRGARHRGTGCAALARGRVAAGPRGQMTGDGLGDDLGDPGSGASHPIAAASGPTAGGPPPGSPAPLRPQPPAR